MIDDKYVNPFDEFDENPAGGSEAMEEPTVNEAPVAFDDDPNIAGLQVDHHVRRSLDLESARDTSALQGWESFAPVAAVANTAKKIVKSWAPLDEAGQKQWITSEQQTAADREKFWSGVGDTVAKLRASSPMLGDQGEQYPGIASAPAAVLKFAERQAAEGVAKAKRRAFLAAEMEAGRKPGPQYGTTKSLTMDTLNALGSGIANAAQGAGRINRYMADALGGADAETRNRLGFADSGFANYQADKESTVQQLQLAWRQATERDGGVISKAADAAMRGASVLQDQLGDWIMEKARELFPVDEARQQEFRSKLAHGTGSMLSFLGPTLGVTTLTKLSNKTLLKTFQEAPDDVIKRMAQEELQRRTKSAATVTSGTLGAGMTAEAEAQAAAAAGASYDTTRNVFLANLPLGASEALPIGHLFESPTGRWFKSAFGQGMEEGWQEFGQTVGANLIAQNTYDPDRIWDQDAWENAAVGFILGHGTETARRAYFTARDGGTLKDADPEAPQMPAGGDSPTAAPSEAPQEDEPAAPALAAMTQPKAGEPAPTAADPAADADLKADFEALMSPPTGGDKAIESGEEPVTADDDAAPLPEAAAEPDADPATADMQSRFVSVLAGKTPRSQWATQLGIGKKALQELEDWAVQGQLLRVSPTGQVRRTGKAKLSDQAPRDQGTQTAQASFTEGAERAVPAERAASARQLGASLPAAFARTTPGKNSRRGILATYTADKTSTARLTGAGADVFAVEELAPQRAADFQTALIAARDANPNGPSVAVKPVEVYAGARTFLAKNGKAGFAIQDGDELVSVFKHPDGPKRATLSMLDLAVQQGATRLDAFDGVLPRLYAASGFRAVARVPAAGLSPEAQARGAGADAVFMVFDPSATPYQDGDGKVFPDYASASAYTRAVARGEGEVFASPNVQNLDFAGASAALAGPDQAAFRDAANAIDTELGLKSTNNSVIGAWRDGAENSVLGHYPRASWENLVAAGAMKGWLANQKQVLVFQAGKGEDYIASFPVSGDLADVHEALLAAGLEFHTLEPSEAGATVHVFGQDQQTLDAVAAVAADLGAQVSLRYGHGEFIGTQKQDGSEEDQRADARQTYQTLLEAAAQRNRRIGEVWQRLRARHQPTGSPQDLDARERAARRLMATPEYQGALAEHGADTTQQPGYGSAEWKAQRRYIAADGSVINGWDAAIAHQIARANAAVDGGVRHERQAYIVIGLPAAGKSGLAERVRNLSGSAIVDADDFKPMIPEYGGGWNSSGVHEEASSMSKDMLAQMLQTGSNLIIPKLGSSDASISRPATALRARGYKVHLVYVEVPKAIAMERAIKRWKATGRSVPVNIYDQINVGDVYGALKTSGAADSASRIAWIEPSGWQLADDTQPLNGLRFRAEGAVSRNSPEGLEAVGGRNLDARPAGRNREGVSLAVPVDTRVSGLVRRREKKTGVRIAPAVIDYAIRLEGALGSPEFDVVYAEVQADKSILKEDVHDLAALLDAEVAKRTTKKAAMERIARRHTALVSFKLKSGTGVQAQASFANVLKAYAIHARDESRHDNKLWKARHALAGIIVGNVGLGGLSGGMEGAAATAVLSAPGAAMLASGHIREIKRIYDRLEDMQASGESTGGMNAYIRDKLNADSLASFAALSGPTPAELDALPSRHDNDPELIALLREAINDGTARGTDGSPAADGQGQVAAEGGPQAQADAGQGGKPRRPISSKLRFKAIDAFLDGRYSQKAIDARAKAQGFTVKAWHGTKTPWSNDVPNIFPMDDTEGGSIGDFGFHVAIGRANAANQIIGIEGGFGALVRKFKASLGLADKAASDWASNTIGDANILPLRLNAQKPFRMTDIGRWDTAMQWVLALNDPRFANTKLGKQKGVKEIFRVIAQHEEAYYAREDDLTPFERNQAFQAALIKALEKHGYDSIIYQNDNEDVGNDSMMLWDAKRVRSAFDMFHDKAVGAEGVMASLPYVEQDLRDELNAMILDEGMSPEVLFSFAGLTLTGNDELYVEPDLPSVRDREQNDLFPDTLPNVSWVPIDDILHHEPHPNVPVVAWHGTTELVGEQFDAAMADEKENLGVHFGTVEQARKIAEARDPSWTVTLDGDGLESFSSEEDAEDYAEQYAENNPDEADLIKIERFGQNQTFVPVLLDMKKVLTLRDTSTDWDVADVLDQIEKQDEDLAKRLWQAIPSGNGLRRKAQALRNALIAEGIDGIRYQNDVEGEGWSYIAFKPGTVKSAIKPSETLMQISGTSNWDFEPALEKAAKLRWFSLGNALRAWFGAPEVEGSASPQAIEATQRFTTDTVPAANENVADDPFGDRQLLSLLPVLQAQPQRLAGAAQDVAARLRAEIKRALPKDVAVRVLDRLTLQGREAMGVADAAQRLLSVSMALGEDKAREAGRHEIIHMLRELGLFEDSEWDLLVERASKVLLSGEASITLPNGQKVTGEQLLAEYRVAYYPMLLNAGYRGVALEMRLTEMLNQELVAKLAESYQAGARYGSVIDSLLARILEFFDAVMNAWRGAGLASPQAVLRRAFAGEIAERAIAEAMASKARTDKLRPQGIATLLDDLKRDGVGIPFPLRHNGTLADSASLAAYAELQPAGVWAIRTTTGSLSHGPDGYPIAFNSEAAANEHIAKRPMIDVNEAYIQSLFDDMRMWPQASFMAYHGTPHTWAPEKKVRLKDGREVFLGATEPLPHEAVVIAEYPAGRLRVDKIGTGEGAQTYGPGGYLTDTYAIGNEYFHKLSRFNPRASVKLDGKEVTADDFTSELLKEKRALSAYTSFEAFKQQQLYTRHQADAMRNAIAELEPLVAAGRLTWTPLEAEGGVYTLSVNADESQILDWDVPVADQHPAVKRALKQAKLVSPDPLRWLGRQLGKANEMKGADVVAVGMLKARKEKDEAAGLRKTLVDHGIKVIRYLDGQSRNQGEGTYNYVILDEDAADVVAKNGEAIKAVAKEKFIAKLRSAPPSDPKMREAVELASFVDVDMSEDARRARAEKLGFDFDHPVYHGTKRAFRAFDLTRPKKYQPFDPVNAVFLTPNHQFAESFGKDVMELVTRKDIKLFDAGNPADRIALTNYLFDNLDEFRNYVAEGTEGTDFEGARGLLYLDYDKHYIAKALSQRDNDWTIIEHPMAQQWLRDNGYDGFKAMGNWAENEPASEIIAIYNPTHVRSPEARFADVNTADLLASFSGRADPDLTKIAAKISFGKPDTDRGSEVPGDVKPLTELIADLKESLHMTVTQGRYGLTVSDRTAGPEQNRPPRDWSFKPQPHLRGQYDMRSGVARIAVSTDIDAIAHEGGHHLERMFGEELRQLMTGDRRELLRYAARNATPPAPNRPMPAIPEAGYTGIDLDADTQQLLVEAAAADRVRQVAENMGLPPGQVDEASAHRALVTREELAHRLGGPIADGLIELVASSSNPADQVQYVRTRFSPTGIPRQPVNDLRSSLSEGFAEFFREYVLNPQQAQRYAPHFYQAFEEFLDAAHPQLLEKIERLQLVTTSKEYEAYLRATTLDRGTADLVSNADQSISKKAQEVLDMMGQKGTVSGFASKVYTAGVDEANPMFGYVRNQLLIGDANGRTDAEGRAVSLAVHENPYKLLRAIGDSFKTGLRWIQDGMPNFQESDGARSASLHEALNMVMGKSWNLESYQKFGVYLESKRAIEEWKLWDAKRLEMANLEQRMATAQSQLSALRAARRKERDPNQVALFDDAMRTREAAITQARERLQELRTKGLQRAPHRVTQVEHAERISKLEAENANYAPAAQMVYDFLWQAAVHDFQAGRLTQDELDYRATRRHFYVPFARDLSDLIQERGFGGRTMRPKFAKDKAFKGSDRSVVNPIETIIDQTFHRAAATHFNAIVKAMAKIADDVGPGGNQIAERVDKQSLTAADQEGFAKLEGHLVSLGYDKDDAREMVKRIESDFGDTQLLLTWSPESFGAQRPLLIPLWENGERKFLRINDPDFAGQLATTLNGVGRDMSSLILDWVAMPAQWLRGGITTHPAFMLPNIIRDMWSSWILTGSVLDPRTWPLITQARGLYHELRQTDMARLYQEASGILGGQNVAALSKVRDKMDVMQLQDRGLRIKPMRLLFASSLGAAAGFAVAGPAGGLFGSFLGAGLHRVGKGGGLMHNFLETTALFADMSETATRLGVFTHAYKAALNNNPSLTPYQAAQEAAFVARDLIDFGRRGSKMLAVSRLVPFLNASIQGLDKSFRTAVSASSDRGASLSASKMLATAAAGAAAGSVAGPIAATVGAFAAPALAVQFAARTDFARRLMQPLFSRRPDGLPISADEQAAVARAAKTWVNLTVYSALLVAIGLLYGDDDEYKIIDPKFKKRAQPVKLGDEWFGIPKAFEFGAPSTIIEAGIDAQINNDPRLKERILDALYEQAPPLPTPQAMNLWSDIRSNYNARSDRPIVPDYMKSLPPQEQYNAYSSKLAIEMSRIVNETPALKTAVEAVGTKLFAKQHFELSPMIIDHAISTGFGYWGKDAQKASNFDSDVGPASGRSSEYPLVGTVLQRLMIDPYRASDAREAFWTKMRKSGVDSLPRAAAGYDKILREGGQVRANQYLSTLPEDQRVYALLMAQGDTNMRRLHPFNRMDSIHDATSSIRREIIGGNLDNTSDTTELKPIVLAPAVAAEVLDMLGQIEAIEMGNTMAAIGSGQFANRKVIDPQAVLNVLAAASPEVAAELQTRLERKKVQPFSDAVEQWPGIAKMLVEDWEESMGFVDGQHIELKNDPLPNAKKRRMNLGGPPLKIPPPVATIPQGESGDSRY
jgi:predicted ABC-type ATPase